MKNGLNIIYLDKTRKNEVEHFLYQWESPDPFIECTTSGSTGTPSTVKHTKENMRVSARKTIEHLAIDTGKTAYLCLSTNTIAGKMMVVRAIEGSLTLVVGPISSDALNYIREPIDFAAIVPLQLSNSLKNDPTKLHLIHKVIVGGAPVSEDLIGQLVHNGLTIFQTYGMTETISHVAMRRIGKETDEHFIALNNIVFSQYTDQTLIIHYPEIGIEKLKTNDVVEIADPEHFKWIGRKDFTINTGGIKVQPEHIESVLSKYISSPFFIAGIPHEELGEQVVLVIQDQQHPIIDGDAFFNELSRFERPKRIFYLDKFEYSLSGKLLRRETINRILS